VGRGVTNAEIVRSLYERWANGENPGELYDPDIEWSMPHPGGQVRGRDDVVAFLRSFMGAWEEHVMELEEVRELDDGRVLTLFTERARGRWSGVETLVRPGGIWTLRDGKIVCFHAFGDRDEARRVAGLD
jgi:ketosteroid isomerase-like protein